MFTYVNHRDTKSTEDAQRPDLAAMGCTQASGFI